MNQPQTLRNHLEIKYEGKTMDRITGAQADMIYELLGTDSETANNPFYQAVLTPLKAAKDAFSQMNSHVANLADELGAKRKIFHDEEDFMLITKENVPLENMESTIAKFYLDQGYKQPDKEDMTFTQGDKQVWVNATPDFLTHQPVYLVTAAVTTKHPSSAKQI